MKKLMESNFDEKLVISILLLALSSCIAISSSQKYQQYEQNFLLSQIIWFCLGTIIVLFIFVFDMEQIRKLTPYLYVFGILLLIFVLFAPNTIAPIRNGAKSWILFPGIGQIQPSEFMKIFLILMLAYITKNHKEKIGMGSVSQDGKYLIKIFFASIIPIYLVYLQNDFGTSLVMLVITIFIIFVSGINWKIIVGFLGMAISVIALLVLLFLYSPNTLLLFMDTYQLDRIYSWLNPFQYEAGIGYQLSKSILAIGSGMISGKGYYGGQVYIPEAHSDFIFTMVAEAFGFIGACTVIFFYFFLIYRIVAIAIKQREETFEIIICIGMIGMIGFHTFQNIGMVSGLLPITGIPLLLMSYGGSSVLATMFGLGIVLNISYRTKKYLFS
ncbi:FtsW/RodA/SpoVE family cell cycle protein [Oceanobacillus chungangensis]|uniref:Rod shape-determining protein RodA n=1 Tax=Oceanobacillus chungangensis TaxID=1229152 RepID=A0A3D8PV90_9BACI|nr:FtsW/RodA/SpoVE family cell cycle protein [Oceanobacillus chungangensis]RDW19642.1 rod shape-determining protein RodA [Oceanobacillus chungangensis]